MTEYICNLISSQGFSEAHLEFETPLVLGRVIDYNGDQWKVKSIDEHEAWLRKIETASPPK